MRISISAEIIKPAVAIFPWIEKPEKAMEWQRNVKAGQILQTTPEVIGTSFKEIIEEGGKSLEMYGTITKFEKNRLIGFFLTSKLHEVDICYSIDEFKNGSKITVEAAVTWKFPMNIINLFIGKKIKKSITTQIESELLQLKELCEAS